MGVHHRKASLLLISTLFTLSTPMWAAKTPLPKTPIPEVFVETISPSPLFEELSYPARISSTIHANVQAISEGVVTELLVHIGSQVQKGQVLLKIRKNDPGFRYSPVRVLAPVGGIISELKASLGSEVARGEILAQVTDPKKLKVLIEITAQDMKLMRAGLQGEMHIASIQKNVPVQIKGVSPILDPVSGTATAELSLSDVSDLQPGSLGFVSFKVNERMGVVVPEHAIIYKGDRPFIRVVENEISLRRNIELGIKNQGHVEIRSGLNTGDQIIVRASGYIGDKEKVKITESQE